MREKITVVKVGGAIVEDAAALGQLLDAFRTIPGRKVLVHGGGRRATAVAARLGLETRMVGGRRVTDADMLEVVTMVYAGLVNKNIVARLQALGLNALGMTGADGGILLARRRPVSGGVDYGYVGDVERADGRALAAVIEGVGIPVIAPLTHDGHGQLLNTNADTMASAVACALAGRYDVTLVYTFEKRGVLRDPADEESVIPVITHADFDRLTADGTISRGMIPKVDNALRAIDSGVTRVVITQAAAIGTQAGTVIRK